MRVDEEPALDEVQEPDVPLVEALMLVDEELPVVPVFDPLPE